MELPGKHTFRPKQQNNPERDPHRYRKLICEKLVLQRKRRMVYLIKRIESIR